MTIYDGVELGLQSQGRPGDLRDGFTSTLTGAASASADAPGTIAVGSRGSVRRVTGAGIVATRERIAVEPGRLYLVRWAASRQTNPTDPAGDTVRFGIQWLTNTKAANGQLTNGTLDAVLVVANGLRSVEVLVSSDDAGAGVDYEWPSGTMYMVPFVQTYGSDSVTNIEVIEWEDVTYSDGVSAVLSGALALKAPLESPAFTGTPTGITKAHVGLGNVNNTADANKPVSTATQSALDALEAAIADDIATIDAAKASTAALEALADQIDIVDAQQVPTSNLMARGGITPVAGDPDTGIPVLFLDKDGALNALKFREAGNPRVVRQGVVGGIDDQKGYVAIGVTADGTAALFGEATLPFAYLKADGNGTIQVFVDHNNEGRQVTFGELDVVACRAFAPGLVRYVVVDPVDGRTSRIASFDPEVIAPTSLSTTSELLGTIGQSNGVGASSDGTEHVYTDENPHPQVLMFNGGIIPREGVDAMTGGPGGTPPVAFAEVDMASLVPAVERFKIVAQSQTHCTSAAVGYLSRGHNFNRRVTVFSAAVGSAAYADIKKGTQPNGDFLLAVEKFAEIETAASRTPSMRYVKNRHGESNITASQATYAGYLDEWIADLRTDCTPFIADAATMTMIVDQVGWPVGGSGNNPSGVAFAQLERGTTPGTGIVCIGPMYWAPYVGIHMSPLGHRRWGDMAAKFMSRLTRGEPARPLYAKAGIRLSATSFLLDYDHDFPIVYDNRLVSDPGGAGVRIIDTGGVVIGCSFDRIIDGRYAKFRMASAPVAATPTVQIAGHGFNTLPGPTTGLRANIRDTDPYRSPVDGAPLYNWACHQAFELPAA